MDKVISYYHQADSAGNDVVLGYVTFIDHVMKVSSLTELIHRSDNFLSMNK